MVIYCDVRTDLKLPSIYQGLIFLADARRQLPILSLHRHADLEINLVVRGTVCVEVDGVRLLLPRRGLLWLFPSQAHRVVDRSDDAQFYVAVFSPALTRRAAAAPGYHALAGETPPGDGRWHGQLAATPFERLRGLLEELTEDGLHPDALNREAGFGVRSRFVFSHPDPQRLNAGLAYLVHAAWRQLQGVAPARMEPRLHPLVRRALDELQRAHASLALPQLARQCGTSASHLSRLFNRDLGMPLSQHRNHMRLERFWELRRDAGSHLEAVYAAGFGSYAQFYKAFVRRYGCGPRRYRLREDRPQQWD